MKWVCRRKLRLGSAFLAVALGLAGVFAALTSSGRAALARPRVAVFPIPHSRTSLPETQIAFRGIPLADLGTISVTGSRSGPHGGKMAPDSDGDGGSFLPTRPFIPGEVVTVRTSLNLLGASGGTFQFTIATPYGIRFGPRPTARRVPGDVLKFRSRPDLVPAAIKILKHLAGTAPGDIFIAPQFGPVQDGPEIFDPNGQLVWFHPVPAGDVGSNFQIQRYHGRPVLTWWEGRAAAGYGRGEDIIYNSSYQQIASVNGANGLNAGTHDFQISPSNTALIATSTTIRWNATSVHGSKRQVVWDNVIQEIDIPTGLVLFQWASLDHIPLSASYARLPPHGIFDYFHANSIDVDDDGNLVISARNTWAVYKVNIHTGAVMWQLGGKHSGFKMGPGASFAFQHDARIHGRGDRVLTIFDDGGGPPQVHAQSRGLKLALNFKRRTATVLAQHDHVPPLASKWQGNYDQLPDGHAFIGWGQQPYFSEYDGRGQIFDARVVGDNPNYRAFRFVWSGTPTEPPAVAITGGGGLKNVFVSWNGATAVARWRVLTGTDPTSLRPVATVHKRGFETQIKVRPQQYLAVQALGSSSQVLGTSPTVHVK